MCVFAASAGAFADAIVMLWRGFGKRVQHARVSVIYN
jgi:hypothetical protein